MVPWEKVYVRTVASLSHRILQDAVTPMRGTLDSWSCAVVVIELELKVSAASKVQHRPCTIVSKRSGVQMCLLSSQIKKA